MTSPRVFTFLSRAQVRRGTTTILGLTLVASAPAGAQTLDYIGQYSGHIVDLVPEGWLVGHGYQSAGMDTAESGQYAWIGDLEGVRHRVGLYDAQHQNSLQEFESGALEVNSQGMSIGYSVMYDGRGYERDRMSAWIADRNGVTRRLGFIVPGEFGYGTNYSEPVDLNETGQVVGFSEWSNGSRFGWVLSERWASEFQLGLSDAPHISSDKKYWSTPVALNDAGYAVGISRYYNGRDASTYGHTTWVFNPWGSSRSVGFQGGIHRSLNGWHDGRVHFLTDSGYCAGFSRRYRGHARNGTTAWVTHVAEPNRPVGLYSGIHTAANGIAVSRVVDLNERGISGGESMQFRGANPAESDAVGQSAWLARPTGETVRVGLYGAPNTHPAGHQANFLLGLNENDAAIGFALRYDPSTGSTTEGQGGRSAWVANIAGYTTELGLIGPAYVRSDGFRHSEPRGLTENRFVWGLTLRFDTGTVEWWRYDRQRRTYAIVSELPRSTAVTGRISRLSHVLEDGTMFGEYNDGDPRVFMHIVGHGLERLDDLVDADLTADGWRQFVEVSHVTSNGYIAGSGAIMGGQSAMAGFLLRR